MNRLNWPTIIADSKLLICTTIALVLAFSGYSQLNGSYTVGGINPDYATLTSANNDLLLKGISGPVTFKIRSGVYTESVHFKNISGSSSINTVTLLPDLNAKSGVTIQMSNYNPNDNYVFRLDSISNVIFKHLRIRAYNQNFCNVFELRGEMESVTIDSCTIISRTDSKSNSSIQSCIKIEGQSIIRKLSVLNSSIIGGNSGVSCFNYPGSSEWKFINNQITNWEERGLGLRFCDSVLIEANDIFQRYNSTSLYSAAIAMDRVSNLEISKNALRIHSYSSYGIELRNTSADSGKTQRIGNNTISCLSTGLSRNYSSAFSLTNSQRNSIVFNSIYINSTTTYGIENRDTTNTIKNNVLQIANGGRSSLGIYSFSSKKISHNCIWNPNGKTSNFTLDSSSLTTDPLFTSTTNLLASAIDLNARAITFTGVTVDFNNQVRNVLNPDIGAFEFTPPSLDLGIKSLNQEHICSGSHSVAVAIKNFGATAINSATINWAVSTNGGSPVTQTPYTFNGTLNSASDTLLNIGILNYVSNSTYKIKAWTSSPNSTQDPISKNDTLVVDHGLGLNGIYSVGGNTPDFANIYDALNQLNLFGVCGPVEFRIRPDTFSASVQIEKPFGVSSTNTVTLTKDTFPGTVRWNSIGTPLELINAEHVTIKNLEINTSGNSTIDFIGICDSITIRNNTLSGGTYLINYQAIDYDTCKNIIIDSNKFLDGDNGVWLLGKSNGPGYNISITNNQFVNITGTCVAVNFQDSVSIINNNCFSTGGSSFRKGFELNYSKNLTILNNKLSSHFNNNVSGIELRYCNDSLEKAQLINNYIFLSNTRFGLYTYQSRNMDFLFNTVRSSGPSTHSYSLYFSGGSSSIKLLNNSLNHAGGNYCLYNQNDSSSILASDYNNFYADSSRLIHFNNQDFSSLNVYQQSSQLDSNSISVDPGFKDSTSTPFNASINNNGLSLSNVPFDIVGVTRNTSSPDIGCIEFEPIVNDAGCADINTTYCSGLSSVFASISNFASNQIDSVIVHWAISSNNRPFRTQPSLTFRSTLKSTNDTSIILGQYNFSEDSTYIIRVYTGLVNGVTDSKISNDTLLSPDFKTQLSGWYTVGNGVGNTWNSIDSAFSDLSKKGLCGPTTVYIKSGSYLSSIVIDSIIGSSSFNYLTILGDTMGKMPRWYSSAIPLDIKSLTHTHFKGLKIETTGSTNAVRFDGISSYIKFTHDSIIGINSFSSNIFNAVVLNDIDKSASLNNVTFDSNTILNGSMSFSWFGYQAALPYEQDNKFTNNYLYGAFSTSALFHHQEKLVFRNNKIESNPPGFQSNRTGIELLNCHLVKVNFNEVILREGRTGIHLREVFGKNGIQSEINNNTISLGGTQSLTGLYLFNVGACNSYHNSVNLFNSNSSSSGIELLNSKIVLNNNSMSINGNGVVIRSSGSDSINNFNNLFTTGPILGYYNGIACSDLNVWIANSKQDSNSISINPQFKSNTDLHIPINAMIDAGKPTNVQTDIDGDSRSTSTPDIGADETNYTGNDASLSDLVFTRNCFGPIVANFELTNPGYFTIDSMRYTYSIFRNDTFLLSKSSKINTALIVGGKLSRQISEGISYQGKDSISIRITLDAANGTRDEVSWNDTLLGYKIIDTLPVAFFSAPFPLTCPGMNNFVLTQGQPPGGTYFGTGILGIDDFLPDVSIRGTHPISYAFTDSNGCRDTIVQNITVTKLVTASFSAPFPLTCVGMSSITLTKGIPSGGRYIGPGVFSSTRFDPKNATKGVHSISYAYTDTKGCKDTVNQQITVLDNPKVELGDPVLLCNNGSVTLDAKNPGATYNWSTGNTKQTQVTIGAGIYRVTVTDTLGCSANADVKVFQGAHWCLGTDEETANYSGLTVYPNPTSKYIRLKLTSNSERPLSYSIYDAKGSIIKSVQIEKTQLNNELEIDVSQLALGTYTVLLKTIEKVYQSSFQVME